jgi:acyl-coenzyme A thioesterase 13
MVQPRPANDLFDISHIVGNASDNIKRSVGNPAGLFWNQDFESPLFGESIQNRMKVVEISLNRKAEEQKKLEARVVVELDVTEGQLFIHKFESGCPKSLCVLDMLNGGGNIHGGCSAFLVDM